jgi:hypothetical protein
LRTSSSRADITFVPHGILITAWSIVGVALAVLVFGPEMSTEAIVAVRLAIVLAVRVFFATFVAATAKPPPPEGPAG